VKVGFTTDTGALSADNATTDASGLAKVTYNPSLNVGQTFAISTITSSVVVTGFGPAVSTFQVVVYNEVPVITNLSIPVSGYKTKETTLTISGKVAVTDAISSMNYSLDTSTTRTPITVGTGGVWSITLTGLSVGTHTVHFAMKDVKNLTSTKDITFEVEKKTTPAKGIPMVWIAVIIIVIIIIIIIAAVAMRGGGASAMPAEKPPTEEKKEEPKPGGAA
jgi:hypothetical protein